MKLTYTSDIIKTEITYYFTPAEPPAGYEYGKPLYPGCSEEYEIECVNINGVNILDKLSDKIIDMLYDEIDKNHSEII